MKKLILSTFIFFVSIGFTSAQCTPSVVGNAGVYPDSATNFSHAFKNVSYNQLITVKVPADTTALGIFATIDYIKIATLTGLPVGLSYSCVPANCQFPGGASNCAIITGIPVSEGIYPLEITCVANGKILGIPPAVDLLTYTLTYYTIVVEPEINAGLIEGLTPNKFSVSPSIPNPSNDKSTIYYNLNSRADVQVKIVNAIGKEMFNTKVTGYNGTNQFVMNTADLPSGIYLYSINNGNSIITKRFIVNH